MSRLAQVVAVEKNVKSNVHSKVTELHRLNSKEDLFLGFQKTYQPLEEEGIMFPPDFKKVQLKASIQLTKFCDKITELLDITATRDWANCNAKADIVVDGEVLVKQAPTSYLLFLEKQLADIKTFVTEMPVLDPSEDWEVDINRELFKSNEVLTLRTKKTQKPIILAEATKEHPAQTQLITEDMVIGNWKTIKFSGAIPAPKKRNILNNVQKLLCAVKYAREEANTVVAPKQEVGSAIFNYILK